MLQLVKVIYQVPTFHVPTVRNELMLIKLLHVKQRKMIPQKCYLFLSESRSVVMQTPPQFNWTGPVFTKIVYQSGCVNWHYMLHQHWHLYHGKPYFRRHHWCFKALSHLIRFECELNSHSPDAHRMRIQSTSIAFTLPKVWNRIAVGMPHPLQPK